MNGERKAAKIRKLSTIMYVVCECEHLHCGRVHLKWTKCKNIIAIYYAWCCERCAGGWRRGREARWATGIRPIGRLSALGNINRESSTCLFLVSIYVYAQRKSSSNNNTNNADASRTLQISRHTDTHACLLWLRKLSIFTWKRTHVHYWWWIIDATKSPAGGFSQYTHFLNK